MLGVDLLHRLQRGVLVAEVDRAVADLAAQRGQFGQRLGDLALGEQQFRRPVHLGRLEGTAGAGRDHRPQLGRGAGGGRVRVLGVLGVPGAGGRGRPAQQLDTAAGGGGERRRELRGDAAGPADQHHHGVPVEPERGGLGGAVARGARAGAAEGAQRGLGEFEGVPAGSGVPHDGCRPGGEQFGQQRVGGCGAVGQVDDARRRLRVLAGDGAEQAVQPG